MRAKWQALAWGYWILATHRCLEAETRLHTGVGVCPGVWMPHRGYMPRRLDTGFWLRSGVCIPHGGYTRLFEHAQAFGSQSGLHTGVSIPNWGYTQEFGLPVGATQVFGYPTWATHKSLDPQARLDTGVWIPKWNILQVATGVHFHLLRQGLALRARTSSLAFFAQGNISDLSLCVAAHTHRHNACVLMIPLRSCTSAASAMGAFSDMQCLADVHKQYLCDGWQLSM